MDHPDAKKEAADKPFSIEDFRLLTPEQKRAKVDADAAVLVETETMFSAALRKLNAKSRLPVTTTLFLFADGHMLDLCIVEAVGHLEYRLTDDDAALAILASVDLTLSSGDVVTRVLASNFERMVERNLDMSGIGVDTDTARALNVTLLEEVESAYDRFVSSWTTARRIHNTYSAPSAYRPL